MRGRRAQRRPCLTSRPPLRAARRVMPSSMSTWRFDGERRGVPSETVNWWANQSLAIARQQGTPQTLRYPQPRCFQTGVGKCAASPTDGLAELRGVLLTEHEWRVREGLV